MPDPVLWRATWLNRLAGFLADTDRSLGQWRVEAAAPGTLPRTRARVEAVIAACEQQRLEVQRLLADVGGGERQLLPTSVEADAGALLQLEENVFRDWAWGQAEVDATRVLVERLVDGPLGRLAIYGAGAGRLAVDVHQALGPDETWALDLNPLPLLVAARLLAGETVTLPEFPVAPHSDQGVVMTHALQSSIRPRPGFSLILADAFQPPFAPASLDTVLTSWFIDANGADFRATAAAVNRVLRPGGTWLNVGPLRFKQDLVTSFTIEEVWELAGAAGFQVESRARDDVPYFDAPASGSRRIETVFSFRARKVSEAAAHGPAPADPAWIADPARPIPLTEGLVAYGRRSVFAGSVISLIDGQRSLNDVAAEMGRLWGFDAARIQDQLRAFFAALPEGTV
ncbi:MAG TPA: methyltransferase domain-containing protein [Polyangia bacterium]|nr:methyltransferase domain-containing protein [Polyangia bacterium]